MSRICVNIACGASYLDGWVNLDYSPSSPTVIKANLLVTIRCDDSRRFVFVSFY